MASVRAITSLPAAKVAALLLATLVVLIGNFLADIAYAALDPRISFRALEAA